MKFKHRLGSAALAALLAFSPLSALAYKADTLRSGMRNEAVKQMQLALISLGYLGGTADGIFGTHTENAVKKFQRANGMKADGLAGTKTLDALYKKTGISVSSAASSQSASSQASATSKASSSASSQTAAADSSKSGTASGTGTASASSGTGLFGGNYATLRYGSNGTRVKTLQQKLISLGYLSGAADGKFGSVTRAAVISFQKAKGLAPDGLAGRQTLTALENSGGTAASASAGSSASSASSASDSSSPQAPSSSATASGPAGAQVKLLNWYNDIKPSLRNGQTVYIYEPVSGQGWNLRIYSCGRHMDAEPVTAEDTSFMLKAFGGENTWSQKAVYVRLPSGTWTVGSTHDMPHMSGSIKSNNFNGHLCVHFLRTMSEAEEKDPDYGVSNQKTIRAFWKKLTGETIVE